MSCNEWSLVVYLEKQPSLLQTIINRSIDNVAFIAMKIEKYLYRLCVIMYRVPNIYN